MAVATFEIKEHLRFLRAVHVASSRGKGSLLYADGPSLRVAVRAYFAWLSKAAESGPWSRAGETAGQALVTRAPPLGIAPFPRHVCHVPTRVCGRERGCEWAWLCVLVEARHRPLRSALLHHWRPHLLLLLLPRRRDGRARTGDRVRVDRP